MKKTFQLKTNNRREFSRSDVENNFIKTNSIPKLVRSSSQSLTKIFQKINDDDRSPSAMASMIRKEEGETLTLSKEELAGFLDRLHGGFSNRKLDRLSQKAVKMLVDETFDDKNIDTDKSSKDRVIVLFQKEKLLESILSILSADDVDVNGLLFSAFEKAQCENYSPPTDRTILQSGSFRYSDQVQFPDSKWKKSPRLAKELKLDLKNLEVNKKSRKIFSDKRRVQE